MFHEDYMELRRQALEEGQAVEIPIAIKSRDGLAAVTLPQVKRFTAGDLVLEQTFTYEGTAENFRLVDVQEKLSRAGEELIDPGEMLYPLADPPGSGV